MSFEVIAYRNRTIDFQGSLFQADGTTGIALQATDVVRFKMGRGDAAVPDLDLKGSQASPSPTPNGSGVTVDQITSPAQYTVRLAQGDLTSLAPGTYDAEVGVVDDSETAPVDAFKPVEVGVVHVIGQMAGDVGKT